MKKNSTVLLVTCIIYSSCSKEEFDIIIQNVNIIDVESSDIHYQKDLAITNQFIVRISKGKSLSQSDSTILINGTNKYLIPGLWDMHVHLNIDYEEYLQLYLANCITGVRDMNGMHLSWKGKNEGSWLASRVVIGSRIIDGPKPTYEWVHSVCTEEEARQADQEMKEDGYDCIKILSLLPENIYKVIVDECANSNIPFAGHFPYSVHPVQAAKMGQQSAEHQLFMQLACSEKEDSLRLTLDKVILSDDSREAAVDEYHRLELACVPTFSQSKANSLFSQLGRLNLWQCPTLIVFHDYIYYDELEFENDPRKKYFPNSNPDLDPIEARAL